MDPDRYRRVKEIFIEATRVPLAERPALLDRLCGDDAAIRAEVESLLEHHHANTLVAEEPSRVGSAKRWPPGGSGRSTRSLAEQIVTSQYRRPIGLILVVALFLLLSLWTYTSIRRAIVEIRTEEITHALRSVDRAFETWWDQEKRTAELVASDLRVRRLSAELSSFSASGATPRELAAHPAHEALIELLKPWGGVRKDLRENPVALFDTGGKVIACNDEPEIGLVLNSRGMAFVEPALAGETTFLPPHRVDQLADYSGSIRGYVPEDLSTTNAGVWLFTPVRDAKDRVIGLLLTGYWPKEVFTPLMKVGDLGETGEAYAFNDLGVMITISRFDEELQELGLRPADRWEYPVSLELRDPGFPLRGPQPPADLPSRPFTHPVAEALAMRGGPPEQLQRIIIEPYRDYRGEKVIGGWKWKPMLGHGFGLIVEMDAREAFAPLRYLVVTFSVLLAVLVCATAAALVSTSRAIGLRRKVSELQQLGAYKVERRLGVGGMGEVFLARHAKLRRPTAVKVIRPGRVSLEALERFEREVQLASQLTHPNTIEIYDYGRAEDGTFYYAMEYVEGPDLAELLATEGSQPPERVIHILRQACGALREAHAAGLIHRDIKPQNLMLCERGGEHDVVKILDFGLVKEVGTSYSVDPASIRGIRGTPMYMAPERLQNPFDVDARIDIYALGAVAYELLSGQPPFKAGEGNLDLLYRVVEEVPTHLSEVVPEVVPPELVELVMECLAKDREARPSSIADLAAKLEALALVHPWPQTKAQVRRDRRSGAA